MKTETRTACESEHDFALVLTGVPELTSDVENALFEAGCDDATLSIRSGRTFLTFSRIAPTLKHAILSAIRNVKSAHIGAGVLRVDNCNLVTQADIARKINRTRQLVHQYMNGDRGPGGFPPPTCYIGDDSPLWAWCEVASWLWQNDLIKENVLREAEQVNVINTALEFTQHQQTDFELSQEVVQAINS